ncbi:MAG: DUF4403 family protein [Proteobacteria bacterium]|nr:DUF4403 family protein [Pseudomonadota bacterium]
MDRRHALALALLISAFPLVRKTLQTDVDLPPRGARVAAPPDPVSSTLIADVHYPYAVLAEGLSENVPEVFVDTKGQPVDGGLLLDLKAARVGDVGVRGDGSALLVEVPVAITARVVTGRAVQRRKARGKAAPQGAQIDADLVVVVRTELSISADWRLEPTTTVSHRWRGRPTLSVGVLRVGLAKIADKLLADSWSEMGPKIAAQMQRDDKMRDKVEAAWAELHQPKALAADPPAWLSSDPEALYASVPEAGEEGLELSVGVRGRFALTTGDAPPAPEMEPLPDRQDPPEGAGFELALTSTLDWQALTAQARGGLVGQVLTDQADVRVTEVELYPSGESVVVVLDLDADLPGYDTQGTMVLSGRPVLDTAAQTVSIAEFDYGLSTDDAALASANAVVRDSVVQTVSPQLVFPYGSMLDDARDRVHEQFAANPQVDGELDGLSVQAVRVTDAGLVVDALASGILKVTLDEKPTPPPMEGMGMPSKPKLPGAKAKH